MEKILTVNEVAEILSVKPITVREMFREKRLRAFKVGKAWRTTETMLREDIESLARGAVSEAPAAVATPTGDDDSMKSKRTAAKPSKNTTKKSAAERADERRATDYPDTETEAEQDTTHEKWMARPEDREGEPVPGAEVSEVEDVPPVPAATKLMNQQEQISGAKQAESAIPPEPEGEADDKEAKAKKGKKKGPTDQAQFEFDGLE